MTISKTAKLFGCTEEQARAQYAANIVQLRAMLDTVRKTGNNVRGYNAEQLIERIAKFEALLTNGE